VPGLEQPVSRAGLHPALLAWVAFVFLIVGASPAHFWLDSGEIAAAGAELGVMHPTGVPGYVPLLHLATALPLGSLGFRMALCSSLCMAGAIGLCMAMLERRGAHWALLWVIGLWMLLSLTLVRHGRVVEIYGFGALLLCATLWGFDPAVPSVQRVSRRGVAVLAAVVGAWGFGDLRLALVPPVLLVWMLDWRRGEPWTRWAPVYVGLASAVVLCLPLASAREPMADWGDPEGWAGIWAHVQATAIRESFAVKLSGMGARAWGVHAREVATRLVEDLGPFGLLMAVAALGFGLSRPLSLASRARAGGSSEGETPGLRSFVDDEHRLARWLAWIAATELLYAVAINPMGGQDRQTGLTLGIVGVLAVGVGMAQWLGRPRAREQLLRWVSLPLLACLLWVPPAFESLPDLGVTRSWAPHAWTREVLARTPTDALLLTQSDDLSAGVAAARALEGARPDLVSAPSQHLFRAPTPWQLAAPRRARVWSAAGDAGPQASEAERVFAVFDVWDGPVGLESPTTGALGGVALPGAGEPPLWVAELPTPVGAPPVGSPAVASVGAVIERWSPRLHNPVDRRHLAEALALWVHGEFARAPESPKRWLELERGYRQILAFDPEHPRSLIGRAASLDRFGATDEAIALTRLAVELEPTRTTGLANLALFLSRDPATLDAARELAELAVELGSDRPNTWIRLRAVCQLQDDQVCMDRADRRGRR